MIRCFSPTNCTNPTSIDKTAPLQKQLQFSPQKSNSPTKPSGTSPDYYIIKREQEISKMMLADKCNSPQKVQYRNHTSLTLSKQACNLIATNLQKNHDFANTNDAGKFSKLQHVKSPKMTLEELKLCETNPVIKRALVQVEINKSPLKSWQETPEKHQEVDKKVQAQKITGPKRDPRAKTRQEKAKPQDTEPSQTSYNLRQKSQKALSQEKVPITRQNIENEQKLQHKNNCGNIGKEPVEDSEEINIFQRKFIGRDNTRNGVNNNLADDDSEDQFVVPDLNLNANKCWRAKKGLSLNVIEPNDNTIDDKHPTFIERTNKIPKVCSVERLDYYVKSNVNLQTTENFEKQEQEKNAQRVGFKDYLKNMIVNKNNNLSSGLVKTVQNIADLCIVDSERRITPFKTKIYSRKQTQPEKQKLLQKALNKDLNNTYKIIKKDANLQNQKKQITLNIDIIRDLANRQKMSKASSQSSNPSNFNSTTFQAKSSYDKQTPESSSKKLKNTRKNSKSIKFSQTVDNTLIINGLEVPTKQNKTADHSQLIKSSPNRDSPLRTPNLSSSVKSFLRRDLSVYNKNNLLNALRHDRSHIQQNTSKDNDQNCEIPKKKENVNYHIHNISRNVGQNASSFNKFSNSSSGNSSHLSNTRNTFIKISQGNLSSGIREIKEKGVPVISLKDQVTNKMSFFGNGLNYLEKTQKWADIDLQRLDEKIERNGHKDRFGSLALKISPHKPHRSTPKDASKSNNPNSNKAFREFLQRKSDKKSRKRKDSNYYRNSIQMPQNFVNNKMTGGQEQYSTNSSRDNMVNSLSSGLLSKTAFRQVFSKLDSNNNSTERSKCNEDLEEFRKITNRTFDNKPQAGSFWEKPEFTNALLKPMNKIPIKAVKTDKNSDKFHWNQEERKFERINQQRSMISPNLTQNRFFVDRQSMGQTKTERNSYSRSNRKDGFFKGALEQGSPGICKPPDPQFTIKKIDQQNCNPKIIKDGIRKGLQNKNSQFFINRPQVILSGKNSVDVERSRNSSNRTNSKDSGKKVQDFFGIKQNTMRSHKDSNAANHYQRITLNKNSKLFHNNNDSSSVNTSSCKNIYK